MQLNREVSYARGLTLAVVGIVVLSPDSLLIRLIETDVWTLLFWRGLLSALALGAFIALRYGAGTASAFAAIGRLGVVGAVLMAGGTALFVISIRLTSVANTLVILSAAPLFSAILSRVFLGEAVPRRTWAAVVAVFAGIAIIFAGGLGDGALLGDLAAVGAALTSAGAFVAFRRARAADMAPAVVLMGLVLTLGVAPLATPLAVDPGSVAYVLVLGAVVAPISFALLATAPRYAPAPDVMLVTLLEAILGPLWVWLVLAEVPPRETFLGGAVILGTLILRAAAGLRQSR